MQQRRVHAVPAALRGKLVSRVLKARTHPRGIHAFKAIFLDDFASSQKMNLTLMILKRIEKYYIYRMRYIHIMKRSNERDRNKCECYNII